MSTEQSKKEEVVAGFMDMTEKERQQMIAQLCESKSDEFARMGYDNISPESIWELVLEGYKDKSMPPIHQLVNDIFSLKINRIMNRFTMDMYKESERNNPFHR